MPTTSSSALRYPASTAAPNVPQDIQNLATDLDRKVIPNYATIAARNSAIPAPTQGQTCSVVGVLHTYDGSGWRFTRYGKVSSVVTDASALYNVAHGGGSTPTAWGISPTTQATDQLNTIISTHASGENSTNLIARFTRSDTNAYLTTNTVSFSWWARF